MKTRVTTILRLLCAASLAVAFGCMEQRDDRDYVDTNVVEKDLFTGEWYHTHTVIDNDQESTWSFAFRGSVSFDQTNSVIGTIARVRFVIDEDWLYAYRSYPVVADADRTPDGGRDMDIFEPMAAWKVESHFDIVRRYNTETGETLNVIEENDQDRPWYERQFMRVDWSSNDLTGGYNFNDIDVWDPTGVLFRDPAGTFVQEGSAFPEQWQPQYDFTSVEEPDRTSWEWEYWDRYGADELYHFAFVTQEIWSTGAFMLLYDWARPHWVLQNSDAAMSALLVTVRHSFLRVPEESQYEPMVMADHEWEQFGAWRVEQPTYTWGDLPDEDGGFTNFYGQTDALNYWAGRHNIWRRSFDVDDEGRRQPIPYTDREVQPVVYTLSERFPAWLIHSSFDLVGEWNGSMMESVRIARGEALPSTLIDGSSCNSDEDCLREYGDAFPFTSCRTEYDGGDSQCSRHYSPFIQPGSEHFEEGDYDCHIVTGDGGAPSDPGYDLGEFEADDIQEQRSWRFTGEECVLTLRNNTCDDPVALAAAIEQRPACEANSDLCCDQMGDLRFNMLAHNDQVGLFFGGVSQPLMDPLTGELIQANANAAGLSVEGAMTYVGWYFSLVDDDSDQDAIDELSMMVGEDVRALMENSNYAIPPVTPSIPPQLATDEVPLAGMGANMGASGSPEDARFAMERFMPRIRNSLEQSLDLQGREGRMRIFSERMRNLEGTTHEQRLLSGVDGMQALGFQPQDAMGLPSEDQLERASVFRNGFFPAEREYTGLRDRMASRSFYPSADDQVEAFMDNSYVNWLRQFPDDTTPQQRSIAVGRSYFRAMMLHEMGHSIGMRHNFAGSLDYDNYHDQYYHIEDEIPLPTTVEYDIDEDGTLDYQELGQYNGALSEARAERELAGVARWRNASIMEYMPRLSNDLAPLGRYDRGFVNFVYGNAIEVYEELSTEASVFDGGRAWLDRPDRASRTHERYFAGGETCRIDVDTDTRQVARYHHEDCPLGVIYFDPDEWPRRMVDACERDRDCNRFGDFHCDAERGWCVSDALPEGQIIGQRCATNPRAGQTEHPEDLPGVCLNYRDSWDRYLESVPANEVELFNPVEYRFCSDERTSDISWCTRQDEGENFREIMHHYRERWVRNYPFSFFRRYRANWGGTSNFGTYADIAKVMSHFYYRYFYEDLYTVEGDVWIDSITDHIAGAAAGMNFLSEVISQPDVGSYEYNPDNDAYEMHSSGEMGLSDIDILPGQGRYMWSSYQEGPFGVFRMERQGSFNDKLYALYALSIRDWGMTYNYDERFWINFYSMFPYEMSQLFGGLILNDSNLYGARVCEEGMTNPLTGHRCDQTTILYQDLWRGSSFEDVDNLRGNPYDDFYADMPAIGGANSEMLRSWAVIFSLAEFPIFYDTTYEQQLYIFVEGTGDSFEIRDCEDFPEDEYCVTEGEDYARYFSDRFNFNVVAFFVEPEHSWEPEVVNSAFILVSTANELQGNIEACEQGLPSCPVSAGPARDAALEEWRLQLEQTESFIISVMDIQGEYGIASWL